jgi:hypothetical protein
MIPTAQSGAYKIAYSTTDFRGVPNPKANPGTLPEHIIPLSQLTAQLAAQRQELEALIGSSGSSNLSAETAARIAADAAMEADLVERINQLALEGVRQKVAVGARVTALPTDLTIPGFVPGSSEVAGRLFVDSLGTDAGLYIAVGGTLTRDPAFMAAGDFQPGLMVWVDSDNTFWLLEDAATGTGNNVSTNFQPFGRMQDLMAAAGSAIAFDGNRITWSYDSVFLNVVGGQATLSEAFKTRISAVETSALTSSGSIVALQSTDASQSSSIAALVTENNLQGLAITSNASDVALLSARTSSVESDLLGKAASSDITALSARTSSVESDLLGKAASSDITALSARTSSVESDLLGKAASSDITALSARTSSVETNLLGKAASADVSSLTNRVSTNESGIASKADASTVLDLSTRTSSVEAALGSKASLSDLLTVAVSKPLTGGIASIQDGHTHTVFTVTFPVAGYTWINSQLSAAPKSIILNELVTHPGNSCVITFVTGLGAGGVMMPIDDGSVTANFLKTIPFSTAFPNF